MSEFLGLPYKDRNVYVWILTNSKSILKSRQTLRDYTSAPHTDVNKTAGGDPCRERTLDEEEFSLGINTY